MDSRLDNIQVIVRPRDLNQKEIDEGSKPCICLDEDDTQKIMVQCQNRPYYYDYVLRYDSKQEEVFSIVGAPIVKTCLQGFNGCIFAYGQTGAGKTHTMMGSQNEEVGIIPRVLQFLFASANSVATTPDFTICCSYLEIYNEQIFDLVCVLLQIYQQLSTTISGLQLREDPAKGVYAQDLTEIVVDNYHSALEIIRQGSQTRHVAATSMNSHSSRSHAIFIVKYESKMKQEEIDIITNSKLNFVDLAGSERQKSAQTTGVRMKEAAAINKSLTSLGLVISNLVQQGGAKHIPYRDSKLTYLLKDSLGGNSKTYMIAAISGANSQMQETISTLKFAERVKQIKNKAHANKELAGEEAKKMRKELEQLRWELSEKESQLQNIQPTDAFQSQLNYQLEEIKTILGKIHSLGREQGSESDLEQQMCEYTEKKCQVLRMLQGIDFKMAKVEQQEDIQTENKLRIELMQQEDTIYRIQKRKKELERQIQDMSEQNQLILNQNRKDFDEQLRLKENIVQNYRDEIDTLESTNQFIEKQLQEQNQTINELNQRIYEFQHQLATIQFQQVQIEKDQEKDQVIMNQQQTISKLETYNSQMRGQFESVHSSLLENKQVYEEELSSLRQHIEMITQQNNEQSNSIKTYEQQALEHSKEIGQLKRSLDQQKFLIQHEFNKIVSEKDQLVECLKQENESNEQQIEQQDEIIEQMKSAMQTQYEELAQYQQIFDIIQSHTKLSKEELPQQIIKRFKEKDISAKIEQIQKSKTRIEEELKTERNSHQFLQQKLLVLQQQAKQLEEENENLQNEMRKSNREKQLILNEKINFENMMRDKIINLTNENQIFRKNKSQTFAEMETMRKEKVELERLRELVEQKLQVYIRETFKKNRVMSIEQQRHFLRANDIKSSKSAIVESLLEIVLVYYLFMISNQLDSIDNQIMASRMFQPTRTNNQMQM